MWGRGRGTVDFFFRKEKNRPPPFQTTGRPGVSFFPLGGKTVILGG